MSKEIPFILNPNSLEGSLMNKGTSVPVILCGPAIYFALLRIFSLSSRIISVSNAYEAEFPASKTNPPSNPAFLFADST